MMKLQDVTREYHRTAAPGKGVVTYGAGYQAETHQSEIAAAQWLHDVFGGDIRLLTEVNEQKVKTADYLWRCSDMAILKKRRPPTENSEGSSLRDFTIRSGRK